MQYGVTPVLSDLHDRLYCLLLIFLCVDFGNGCAVVAEDDAGGFEAELLSQVGHGVVA